MRDVIIIGAGGGGPVVAKELAARGLDVLLLEAGAHVVHPEFTWTLFENDAINVTSGYHRFGPANRSKPGWKRDLAQPTLIMDSSGVGGTTQKYAGNCPRAMPGVFLDYAGNDKNSYDSTHLFPFSYEELIPYYEWVEQTLPVQTAPMGTKEEIFLYAAEKMGLPLQTGKDINGASYRPQENAILQPIGNAGKTSDRNRLVYPRAYGCHFCGHCYEGCVNPHGSPVNLKAKRSTNSSYVPMALKAESWSAGKSATLIADAFATRINVDSQQVARSVTWRIGSTGEVITEYAKIIVMAGGSIETPRLWLNSALPNPNDQVGRGLTDHYQDSVVGIMPFYTGNGKGPASNARIDYPGHGMLELSNQNVASQVAVSTFSNSGIAGVYQLNGADMEGRLIGLDLKDLMSNFDRLLNITIITDDDVELQNRVTLSNSFPPDEHGQVARLELNYQNRSARTMNNRKFLVKQAIELLRATGATKIHRSNWPPFLFHMHSTMRMGLNENDSVLDSNGESRWVKRLFIADASALPNALGGPNPALTLQALATRTAEKIFQLYFNGETWVDKETPVSSVDIMVTQGSGGPTLRCNYCHVD